MTTSYNYTVSNLIMSSGERFPLLRNRGAQFPDPWIVRYCAVVGRGKSLAVNTLRRQAQSVALARTWGEVRGVDLDARLDSGELFTHEETVDLVGWMRTSLASGKARSATGLVNVETHCTRVLNVRAYFSWRAQIAIHRISVASGRYRDASQKLEDWQRMIGSLVRGGGAGEGKKGLLPEIRKRFLEVIHPDFPGNPFEPAHRHRNLPDDRFEAFLSFIQSLTEAAKMVPNVLLVGSLPESDQEAGGDKGVQALRRLERVFGRTGSPWLAAHGNETYEIVRRRLFQELDAEGEKARDETVKAFHNLYKANPGEFPGHAKEPRYGELLKLSYPIHPELFERLSKDWATLDNFQRTRGVLRFMANVVSVLWQQRTRDPLILPARVPLSDERVKASAIYPLDPAYSAVIDSEVDGEGSLPARMESNTTRRISQARAATRSARAVFLCSAPTVGQPQHGVTGQGIRLAAAEPGDQLAIFGEALRELHENATYLYEDARRYWFSTQPTLNRLADERSKALPSHQVDAEIVRILGAEGSHRGTGFARIHAAPDTPSAIDEAPTLSLVILPPAVIHSKGAQVSSAIDSVTDTLTRCRSAQRRYRNTLIFAAPDDAALSTAKEVIRKSLAWTSIEKEAEKGELRKQLTQAQVEDVKERARNAREAAEKAVRSAWIHVLYAEKQEGTLDGKPFDIAQTTLLARDRPSIAVSVYEKLSPKSDGIVKETLGPRMLTAKLANLWPGDRPHLQIAEVTEWFAAYVYLPKLRDAAVLASAISEGVSTSDPLFGYADRFNEETGRYEGLAFRRLAPPSFTADAVIVRKDVAETAANIGVPSPAPVPGGSMMPGGGVDGPSSPTSQAKDKPTRFFGSVDIDVDRPVKSFDAILNAVILELQRNPGTKVKLTLEIEADAPGGFDEGDIGVVRDNARQLKFKAGSTGFD